jgi:hypothetical protein
MFEVFKHAVTQYSFGQDNEPDGHIPEKYFET